MEIVISLISLAGSILYIILFFKLWKACNTINDINNKMTSASAIDLISSGQKEIGVKTLKIEYFRELRKTYLALSPIEDVIAKYKPIFEELGVNDLPDYLREPKACESYFAKLNKMGF